MAEKRPYLLINLILAGLIALVFIYSGLFSPAGDKHPVPSFYEEITGTPGPSSGMSRAFSEILRGHLDSAREYHPDSVLIFSFFLVQFAMRVLVSLLLARTAIRTRTLWIVDMILSLAIFLYCFQGLFIALARHLQLAIKA